MKLTFKLNRDIIITMNLNFIVLLLLLATLQAHAYDINPWDSTDYIYLAKPVYIYTTDTKIENSIGELSGLKKLIQELKEEGLVGKKVHYILKIEKVIYGKKKETIDLDFKYIGDYQTCDSNNDFNNHTDDNFWFDEQGRSEFIETPDKTIKCLHCSNDNTSKHDGFFSHCFELNEQYLIIGNSGLGSRQFELIKSQDDQWLHYVKDKAKTIKTFKQSKKEYRKYIETNSDATLHKLKF